MRLPPKSVKEIAEKLNYSVSYVSKLLSKTHPCSPRQAEKFEIALKELGYDISKELLVFGSKEDIKGRILGIKTNQV